MKATFFLIVMVFVSCRVSNSADGIGTELISNPMEPGSMHKSGVAEFSFDKTEIDLGVISQGEKHTVKFEFKNVGDSPLLINAINASCGCTIPKGWHDKEPVQPGEKGVIEAEFDSSTKRGKSHSEITVAANTLPSSNILIIKADVLTPE